jgi:hypothetical protein
VRREIARSVALALCACAPAAACGLTADFSGLQDGGADAPDATDTTDATDANHASDANHPTDVAEAAPVDSADAGDGGTPGFCATLSTPVHFCDDFDEGQTIGAGWDAIDVYQGSSVLLDFTYYSPPASFLSQISDSNAPASARLQKDLPIDTPHVHFEFEMLLPQLSGDFELCTLHEPVADGTTYGVFYKYQNGNLLLYARALLEDGGESDFTSEIGPPPSGWLHVAVDTDISASATIVVTHNGTVVVNATNVNTLTATRASMFVELGYYSDNAANTLAHFDNVIIDWK